MTITSPQGFRAAGVTAGLKASGKPDVALVVNDGPSDVAAAVFTTNRCKANPVLWSEQVMQGNKAKAVVLNSGGANCYTGPEGFQNTHASAELVADKLGIGAIDVVVCSTGLIGEQLQADKLMAGITDAAAGLSTAGGPAAAEAIMTTDTRSKEALREGGGWSIGGMAKGAGMLAPALATMLVVVTTDAQVDADTADRALRAATRVTFDRLDSDGCMSTNDTVLLMCSGASGVTPDEAEFTARLTELCHDLAQQLLGDAEGADHDIAIEVVNAATEDDAVEVGRAIARSNLFKTAVFGKDPNWGRILASVGTTNAAFEPGALDVAFNGVWICKDGQPGEPRDKVDLTERAVSVIVDLKAGEEKATIWTNDLTHAYVHENSAYST
ncbi:bifunctional glutamate N-acetyltransferase/amino-acid acetyltransferase ArgJ [Prauserella flavalba]|uniref:Arginine biosynthesis bifunctional protein ArgJ n=1 Tax=Prauserella flavalba TaxID=1477506 RepID=A0A318LGL7_9PSEU|nr:bifunctional glutamate N-acetyltransferase/amino-acid acetyltransferase ArgJ [Prauserella flavalba]PXY28505.1 bifunctional ornithine acetyltransferase/N-acetylglutamate synthase [Prauserella flavalba]